MTDLTAIWSASLALKRQVTGNAVAPLDGEDQAAILAATVGRWTPKAATGPLTARAALEIVCHEAIVREAYKDSVGVWTFGIGLTDATGHLVGRYKDNPQPVEKCLALFIWALKQIYIPAVLKAFDGHELTEAQFAAALSFHYNTGAIGKADWVRNFKAGEIELAKAAMMNWRKPPEIIGRRTKERDLFFDGKWSNNGMAVVFPVAKPSYRPDFRRPQLVDIRPMLDALL